MKQALQLIYFAEESLRSYHKLVSPVIRYAHGIVRHVSESLHGSAVALRDFIAVDQHMHTQTLNHVNRRASFAQGAALLTLYTKAFSGVTLQGIREASQVPPVPQDEALARKCRIAALIANIKSEVRAGRTPGHLASVWGIFTAALGIGPGEHPR